MDARDKVEVGRGSSALSLMHYLLEQWSSRTSDPVIEERRFVSPEFQSLSRMLHTTTAATCFLQSIQVAENPAPKSTNSSGRGFGVLRKTNSIGSAAVHAPLCALLDILDIQLTVQKLAHEVANNAEDNY